MMCAFDKERECNTECVAYNWTRDRVLFGTNVGKLEKVARCIRGGFTIEHSFD